MIIAVENYFHYGSFKKTFREGFSKIQMYKVLHGHRGAGPAGTERHQLRQSLHDHGEPCRLKAA